MSFAYEMGLRGPRCNGCEYAQLKHMLGTKFLQHDTPEGWIAVYELDRESAPGQGRPLECGGRPICHRATFMSIGHSDECYRWKPGDEGVRSFALEEEVERGQK